MTSYFRFPCPHCQKTLKVAEDAGGKTRRCPYCKNSLRIPEPDLPDESAAIPSIVVADTDRSPTSMTKRPRRARRRRRHSWFSAESSDTASSDVSLILSGLIGLGLTVVWLAAVYPLRSSSFGQLFWDRGWVPFATTFLMFWSIGILILKRMQLKRQRESMLVDVLPTELSEEITPDSLDQFVDHIHELPGSSQESFLINRVLRGIEHFRVRRSAAETVTMMEMQSAIDANNVQGSYTLVKVFIWTLPLLGFIGTVIGVSTAVASLAGSLDSASDMTAMKGALNEVFGGLRTAFDTTLLALIMSIVVKIPASALQKSEEDLITAVDEYCNENLLRRLDDGQRDRHANNGAADPSAFRDAFEAVMGNHHEELQKQLSLMNSAAEQIQETLASVASATADMKSDLAGSFNGLARGLKGLNGVLARLGEETVVIQQVEAPPRRRWFGFLSGSNRED